MRRWSRIATFLAASLAPVGASADPPPLRDAEPLPLARSVELSRRPVELAPAITASLALCRGGSDRAACRALGPAYGGELAALYRPTPYFAFGGSAAYSRADATLRGRALTFETTALAMVGRVYMLEEGAADPYLEGLVGWATAPFARAGGGIDWFVGPGVKVGVLAGYSELMQGRGALTAGFGASLLFGERL